MSLHCNRANLRSNCKVPFCFALWYALNVAYNITNKWALESVRDFIAENTTQSSALPLSIGALQFGIGAIYACTLWLLGWRRPVPHLEEIVWAATKFANYASKLCWKTTSAMRIDRYFGQLSPRPYTPMTSPNNDPSHANKEYNPTISKPQNHSPSSIRDTFHIAVHHTLGQLCTVMSLSASSISFAHVIKAMEPLFSALASRLVLGQKMDIRVYLSLMPVVGGVIMACAGSREFSWISFWSGMSSNAFFAMRGVVSKVVMERHKSNASKNNTSDEMNNEKNNGTNGMDEELNDDNPKDHLQTPSTLSPANLFAAVTCVSFFLSLPLALIAEGRILKEVANIAAKTGVEREKQSETHQTIITYIILSGLLHYLNNEVMYLVLSDVHPISLAVGNTMKRVFIIVAGVLVFATPLTLQTTVGSVIGIGGVFVYSIMKQWYGSASDSGHGSDAGMCSVKAR